jgi:hypothetical protein
MRKGMKNSGLVSPGDPLSLLQTTESRSRPLSETKIEAADESPYEIRFEFLENEFHALRPTSCIRHSDPRLYPVPASLLIKNTVAVKPRSSVGECILIGVAKAVIKREDNWLAAVTG